MRRFGSEVDLAAAVASWGEATGWDVYKEVHTGGGDADLVFRQGRTLWIIETKLTLSSTVLEQAHNRLSYAHYVSVAAPWRSGMSFLARDFATRHGLGVLYVRHPEDCRRRFRQLPSGACEVSSGASYDVYWPSVVDEKIRPRVIRPNDLIPRYRYAKQKPQRLEIAARIAALRASLRPEHKTLVAGAPGGKQMTPWRITFLRVQELLRERGAMTVREIADAVAREHHWCNQSSARAGIYRMVAEIKESAAAFRRVDRGNGAAWEIRHDLV